MAGWENMYVYHGSQNTVLNNACEFFAKQMLENFITEYFDQNPISQVRCSLLYIIVFMGFHGFSLLSSHFIS